MSATPPNHAPTPVQEQANPALPANDDCEAIKDEFGIETDSHKANSSGATKKTSRAYQSHHVLQDAATDDLISRSDALAIMLGDSHRGTEHGTITARQNGRMNNKEGGGGGALPATNFGDLKKQAREDLVAGLTGKRTSKKTGKPMTKAEAEKVADCVVGDAEKKVKDQAEANGETVTDETPVKQPQGCVAPGTLVRLASGARALVETLVAGQLLYTPSGPRAIARIDRCHHDLIELRVDGRELCVASSHRVLLFDGELRRADACRSGDWVATAHGPRRIDRVRPCGRAQPVVRVAFASGALFALGTADVLSFAPENGPKVVRTATIGPCKSTAPALRGGAWISCSEDACP